MQMNLISMLRQRWHGYSYPGTDTEPAIAYDLWARNYDSQPENLMLALDEALFSGFLERVNLKYKIVADIGCGTGRHWGKILSRKPLTLYGYDVSEGMLSKLKGKFPDALVYYMENNYLPQLGNNHVDTIISTLTIAHIENIKEAFLEWRRVLKDGGEVIITDYHPEALARGGRRTFAHNGKTIAIKNYVHSIEKVFDTMQQTGFEFIEMDEKIIDDSMKRYYEEKQALHVFEKFKNVPIIYGMRLRKRHVTT
jgi:ubiquinone/menaquinone biosynthesis C-methylase UbiE